MIRVRVSFTDDAGNAESVTSAATAAVRPKLSTPATGVPTINGVASVGDSLTFGTSSISNDDGITNATFGFQWVRDDSITD